MLSLCSGIVLLQSGSELIVFQARFWIYAKAEQSGTKVEQLGTKEGLSRESYGCIIIVSRSG